MCFNDGLKQSLVVCVIAWDGAEPKISFGESIVLRRSKGGAGISKRIGDGTKSGERTNISVGANKRG